MKQGFTPIDESDEDKIDFCRSWNSKQRKKYDPEKV